MEKPAILIVEDEAIVANDLKQTLKDSGYTVTGIAKAGELALEKVKENQPDLVLMDIHLAGEMDGVEAAGRIHSLYDIPVIFLTAYADSALIERAKITEPYGYILKPYDERELHSVIEVALYKHRIEHEIKKRDAILFAVSSAVEWLLRVSREKYQKKETEYTFNTSDIREILGQIGLALEASSIGIFSIQNDAKGSLSMNMNYEWTGPGVPQSLYKKELNNVLSPPGLSRWQDLFSRGEVVSETRDTLPEPERWFFKILNVQTGIMLPIVMRDSLWGFIGFFNTSERHWSVEEIESLRITANLLGAAMA